MIKKPMLLFAAVLFAIFSFESSASAINVETFWHGQFRINSYYENASKDDVFTKSDDIQASRLRFRPTLDLKFDNNIMAHIQLNIGHINSNVSNARFDNSGNPAVALRHGYISAPIPGYENFTLVAGLIPMSDKFGDTLFSSAWDYNPLTYEVLAKVADTDLRLAHGNLKEGNENHVSPADDVDQWFVDWDTKYGVGFSFYALNDNSKPNSIITNAINLGSAKPNATHTFEDYIGVRYAGKLEPVDFNAFLIYNWGKRRFDASPGEVNERKNSGIALKAEAKVPIGAAKAGILAIYTSGDKKFGDPTESKSHSFITPMSIVGTTGYWGYTGKLNVQGPTDTGVDNDNINIDGATYSNGRNLGRGLTTIQANLSFPVVERLSGYAAAGWYRSNSAPAGRSKNIGTDLYVQARYMFASFLSLDAGVDYAFLGKGHPNSSAVLASEEARNVTLLFTRLQLEY